MRGRLPVPLCPPGLPERGVTVIRATGALLCGVLLMLLASGLLTTLLSVRMGLEGVPDTVIGVVMSSYFLGFVIGSLLCRRIVARAGHIRSFAIFAALISAAAVAHTLWFTPAAWGVLRAVAGFAMAGMYVVVESWLNGQATNRTRGHILSIYMITVYLAIGFSQFLLIAGDPADFALFGVVAILFSLALIPVSLTRAVVPSLGEGSFFGPIRLYRISPLGVAGVFMSGAITGAFYGVGPLFATGIGLGTEEIALFMGVTVLGGLVMQWPMGYLSDRFDRRSVILGCTVALVALVTLGIVFVDGNSLNVLLPVAALYGGLSFSLYPLSTAHANDYIPPGEVVPAISGLLLINGVGAMFGPSAAAALMERMGPAGLFVFIAILAAVLALFILYRMRARPALPAEEQGPFTALMPQSTPVATELYSGVEPEPDQYEFDFGSVPAR